MKKLKSRRGFTLVELLCAVVILVLLAGVMTAAIKLASDSYTRSVAQSESQILSSTLSTAICDELRFAGNTVIQSDGTIRSFFSQKYGELSSGFSLSEGHILLGGNALLADSAYTNGQTVTWLSVIYDVSSESFSVSLEISRKGSVLAEKLFTVKPVNPVIVTEE